MNTIKKIKYLLHKIKSDLESLNTYPGIDLSSGFKIDYDKYWKKRRGEDYKSSLSGWQKERRIIVISTKEPSCNMPIYSRLSANRASTKTGWMNSSENI